ncbi:LysR family transcriptional regulator [Methylocella sp. CPCC 101449]|uniref:LysR family transcriptional regulator n=1 Tax=Methylocella sp. CPCC 101449 TaxID=2987531 RepID=UPI0028932D61|nr:LysR family transcriptional regulator [Methylocella sp. CPCC 101449]
MNVTLRQVRAFLEIASLRSFTRASERLNVPQSSLSVLISELEAELQTRLLKRTTRMVALTEAGREFLPYAERLLMVLDEGIEAAREVDLRRRGQINVIASPLVAVALLPPAIARFQDAYPGIHVTVTEFPPHQISTHVAQSLCDCGFGVFDAQDDGLISAPIIQGHLMLLCAPSHPLAAQKKVGWKDLAGHPLIAVRQDNAARRRLDRQFEVAGLAVKPRFEVRNMVTILGMVAANLGISIWPSWAAPLAKSFQLELRPLVQPQAHHIVSVITSKDRSLSPAATAFIETVRAHAQAL